MQLPPSLQLALESLHEIFDIKQLTKAREDLTQRYRQAQFMATDAQRLAYLFARLPATYAALRKALQAIQVDLPIKSVLDLGAGPGTGMWAACETFPELEAVTLMEKDPALIAIGRHLAQFSEQAAIRSANWQEVDLETLSCVPEHDLIVLSYSIGELHPSKISPLIQACWQSVKQLLLVVEPGTPVGFERIRLIRRCLIEWGANIIAPCPHHLACPMANGDWCHFAARVERSFLHRRLKEGSLGYEDEKFSYIAVTKQTFPLPATRVLSPPVHHSGHTNLKLCTAEGVQRPIISRKMKEAYKQARKIEWGDSFP